jgi:hypothetical protein
VTPMSRSSEVRLSGCFAATKVPTPWTWRTNPSASRPLEDLAQRRPADSVVLGEHRLGGQTLSGLKVAARDLRSDQAAYLS